MNDFEIRPILESLFFVSDSPIRLETLVEILPEANKEEIIEGIRQIQAEYENSSKGIELAEIAGGYQFRTKPDCAAWVSRLKKVRAIKLSQAALETLAIVAYRQPVIRPAVEEIRGVDSGSVLHTLMEKGLIRVMGRKELPGRPIVYGTTKAFLELFGLNSLSDLPTLKEIQPPATPEAILENPSSSPSPLGDSAAISLQESAGAQAPQGAGTLPRNECGVTRNDGNGDAMQSPVGEAWSEEIGEE
jgi:segregation and condensation protein B